MEVPVLVLGLLLALAGVATAAAGVAAARQPTVDLAEVLRGVEIAHGPVDDFERRLAEPFHRRVIQGVRARTTGRLAGLLPRNYLDGVQHKLVLAGQAGARRAEEVVAGQLALTAAMAGAAVAYVVLGHPPPRLAGAALVLLPVLGLLAPHARLNRAVAERKKVILRDLPDTLDLLAISVEAGMGFEGALDVVCRHFTSPLADEFSLALQEMQLGITRREAFQNLRTRTDVPELSNFIVALLQGDALGIPIGRVLKTQASEMRSQRRMWAREKAGKLPVKILFPLMAFIFPPIFVVILGPAAVSMSRGL